MWTRWDVAWAIREEESIMTSTVTKPFDPSKPVSCRDGRPARIICTDRKTNNGREQIVFLRTLESTVESVHTCDADGNSPYGSKYGLVNTPSVRLEYQNVYVNAELHYAKRYSDKTTAMLMTGGNKTLGVNVYRFEDETLVSVTFEPNSTT